MESVLSVSNIKKSFVSKIKHSGLNGSYSSLIKPEYNRIYAVQGISFNMEPGERLGSIGPIFGALTRLLISTTIFRLGLRRYESGSAIQIEVSWIY